MCLRILPHISAKFRVGDTRSSARKIAATVGSKSFLSALVVEVKGVITDANKTVFTHRKIVILRYMEVCHPPSEECASKELRILQTLGMMKLISEISIAAVNAPNCRLVAPIAKAAPVIIPTDIVALVTLWNTLIWGRTK